MRNRSRLAAVAALLALALAGCAGIPSSGGVHAGRGVENEVSPEFDFLARSPQPGATQEEILLGFVEAAASPHDRYAVAKEYLTPEFSAEWDPDSSALIDSGTLRSTQPQGADSIALTVSALADVSATGDFVQREEPTTQVLGYEFSRVGEQWRISSAPQGILVDQPTFALVFGSYPLYFFDPTFSYLVPDLRWFPRRTSTPTVIVKALLSGPSDWLADAVQSAFPEGTALASDSVRIVARDAIVDLSPGVLQTEAVQLSRMRLQLRESLRNVSAISGVAITVDQIEQQIPEVPGTVITDPHVDPRALILRDGQIGYLATTGDTITPLEQSAQITALNPTAVNLGVRQQSGDTAAVLSADGVHVARAGSDARLLDDRAGLIAPPSTCSATSGRCRPMRRGSCWRSRRTARSTSSARAGPTPPRSPPSHSPATAPACSPSTGRVTRPGWWRPPCSAATARGATPRSNWASRSSSPSRQRPRSARPG